MDEMLSNYEIQVTGTICQWLGFDVYTGYLYVVYTGYLYVLIKMILHMVDKILQKMHFRGSLGCFWQEVESKNVDSSEKERKIL